MLVRFAVWARALLSGGADDAEPYANIGAIRSVGVGRFGIRSGRSHDLTSSRSHAAGSRFRKSGLASSAPDHAGRGAGVCTQPPTGRACLPRAHPDREGERRGAPFAVLPAPWHHRSVPGRHCEQHDRFLPGRSLRRPAEDRRYLFANQQRRELETIRLDPRSRGAEPGDLRFWKDRGRGGGGRRAGHDRRARRGHATARHRVERRGGLLRGPRGQVDPPGVRGRLSAVAGAPKLRERRGQVGPPLADRADACRSRFEPLRYGADPGAGRRFGRTDGSSSRGWLDRPGSRRGRRDARRARPAGALERHSARLRT